MSKQSKLFGGEDEEIKKVEKMDLETAEGIAGTVLSLVDAWCKQIEIVGSIRRKKAEIHDIDFVVQTYEDEHGEHWKKLKDSMITMAGVKVILNGDKIFRTLMSLEDKWVQVDFYRTEPETYGIYKLVRTGSADNNIYLAKLAIKKGLRLRYSKGVIDSTGKIIAGETEEGVFKVLGLPFIRPELREVIGGKPIWKKI